MGRIVLYAISSWISKLICEYPATHIGGHSGVSHIYRRIAQSLHCLFIG